MNHPEDCALACPVCDRTLRRTDSAFECEEGHSFDVAREGYVNLLPSQHVRRGIAGDVAEMLQARRRFLDAGHYEPLLAEIAREAEAVSDRCSDAASACILEVGCGEGYFIGGLSERRSASSRTRFLGTDVSKNAVKHAARKYRNVTFFVADVHHRICVTNAGIDVLLDIFAPRNPSEFARVLAPGGSALIVIPGPTHLESLRAQLGLLHIEPDKERRVIERFADLLELRERREIRYALDLSASDVADVVEMGPNYWHERAPAAVGPTATEASFVVLRFERTAGR